MFAFAIFVWVVGSEETLLYICSKILQQCVQHVAIVFWSTDLVDYLRGGMTTLDLKVRRLLGDIGVGLFT